MDFTIKYYEEVGTVRILQTHKLMLTLEAYADLGSFAILIWILKRAHAREYKVYIGISFSFVYTVQLYICCTCVANFFQKIERILVL